MEATELRFFFSFSFFSIFPSLPPFFLLPFFSSPPQQTIVPQLWSRLYTLDLILLNYHSGKGAVGRIVHH